MLQSTKIVLPYSLKNLFSYCKEVSSSQINFNFSSVFLPNVSLAPYLPKWNKRSNIHDIKYYYCLHMVLWDNLLYVTSGPNFVLSCQLVPRTSLLQYLKIKLFIVSRNNSRILTISRIPLHCLLQNWQAKK